MSLAHASCMQSLKRKEINKHIQTVEWIQSNTESDYQGSQRNLMQMTPSFV